MEDNVTLTGDEAVLASRIKTIDRGIDTLEQRIQESVIRGLHGSGAAMMTNITQTSAAKRKAALWAELRSGRGDPVPPLQLFRAGLTSEVLEHAAECFDH